MMHYYPSAKDLDPSFTPIRVVAVVKLQGMGLRSFVATVHGFCFYKSAISSFFSKTINKNYLRNQIILSFVGEKSFKKTLFITNLSFDDESMFN